MKNNPYEVLGLSQSATKKEVILAKARALKAKQYSLNQIAEAEKCLLDPKERLLADFLQPVLPTINRFRKISPPSSLTSISDVSEISIVSPYKNAVMDIAESTQIDKIVGQRILLLIESCNTHGC